jgi:hypothetical protein
MAIWERHSRLIRRCDASAWQGVEKAPIGVGGARDFGSRPRPPHPVGEADGLKWFLGLNVEDEAFVYSPHHAGSKLVGG